MSKLQIATPEVFEPLLAEARYKCSYGGRGSGKSDFFSTLLVEESIASKTDFVCLREVQKSLRFSVKREIENAISRYNAGAYFDVQDKIIKSAKGGIVIFEGMQNHTADSIKSLSGFDRAWVEEAQSLSQRSLDLLRPTIRKPKSQLWFSWNPENPDDPVDNFFRGAEPPESTIIVRANYKDNPYFPDELRADMEYDKKRDPDKYAHIWLGEYQRNSESRVFRNWKVEEFEAPQGTVFRLGADWGYAADPSVLVRCYIDGRNLYVDYESHMIGCEIDQLPDLFDRVPDSRKWFITADSSRPETISYMQKHGYPKINRSIKGANSVEEGIEFLKTFDIIVHPRCVHTIDELTMYSFKTDPLTNKVLPILEDKNNHVIDALRYACEAIRRAKPVKEIDDTFYRPSMSFYPT